MATIDPASGESERPAATERSQEVPAVGSEPALGGQRGLAAAGQVGDHARPTHRLGPELLEALPAIIWEADAKTLEFSYVSPATLPLLGYTVEQWLAEPGFLVRLIHPEDREQVVAECLGAIAAGRDHELEYRLVAADGRALWFRDIVHVSLDGDGQPDRLHGVLVDTTERRRMEEMLRDREAHFRSLIEKSSEIITLLGPGGGIRYASPSIERLLGHRPEEVRGRTILQFVHPDDAAVVTGTLASDLLLPGSRAALNFRFHHKDGSWRVLDGAGANLMEDPAVAGLVVNFRDVTERTRVEEASRRLGAIIAATTDLVATTDAHGRVLYLNRAGRRMLAIPEDEEITSLTISDMHPYGETALLISEGIGAALREGVWSGETLLLARDGRQIPVSEVILAHNTAAGQLEFLSLIIRDISERKRAEEELRQSEEHFRSLIENVSDIITVLGPLGDIRYASPSVERVLGYAPEELVGASAFDFSHPEDVPSIQAGLAESMRQPRATASFEFRFRHKNGSWRMLEATGKSTLHHPTTAGAVINARDVTERQEMQTQLHQSQKMDAVGRLAGGVAHDFNNLLTAIKGHCSLLLMDLRPQDPMRLSIEEIDKASDRAASLTQQLLAFSRRQVLQPRVLDLNGVVTETEMMLRRLIGEDIELVVHRDPRLGSIKADPGQIGQVLVNLAVNARDAMPAGGKLTIETRDLEVDEEHTRRHAGMRAGSYVLLVVRDTGCGMDEDTLSHVFEPFFTTKEQSRGTGLGLSTVYGIIKQSAGYIWVTSEPGQGTTFEIYLPRTAEAAPGSADSNAEPAAPYGSALYGSETVLLVEDEHAVRALVRRVLERNGYSVLEAPDGAAALRLTQQYDREIHLLISDVVMPEMGGRQLAESLSRLRPAMRVLFMSGYSEDAILHHVVLEPGTDFLAKPFTPDALARTVRQVLDAPTAKPGDTPA